MHRSWLASMRKINGDEFWRGSGRLFPTLPTLLRIALVFSVGLDYFFAGAREQPLVAVVRKAERVPLPDRQDGKDMSYRFESLDYPATERRFNSVLRRVPCPWRATTSGCTRTRAWSSSTRSRAG